VRAQSRRLVSLGPRRARENKELKEFLNVNLYSHRQLAAERKGIVRRVRRLFSYYLEHPRGLPPFYVAQSQEEPLHRVVCDYIAGMTNNYLLSSIASTWGQRLGARDWGLGKVKG